MTTVYRVRTVAGDRLFSPPVLTLPHEHLHVGLPPEKAPAPRRSLTLDERTDEVSGFLAPLRERGVGLIVDTTGDGVGRDPALIAAVSDRLGIPFVMSTGLWKERGHPDWVRSLDADALAERFVGEIETGIGESGVRAGLIKVASNEPMTEEETKAFRAAARAQRRTGVTITTHTEPGRVGLRQLELLLDEGADPARIIIGHLDTTNDPDYHAAIAAVGAFVEFDRVGAPHGIGDEARARLVVAAVERGYADRILLSHDAHALQLLVTATEVPRPFTTLFDEFLPRLRALGLDDTILTRITSENPLRAIGWVASS